MKKFLAIIFLGLFLGFIFYFSGAKSETNDAAKKKETARGEKPMEKAKNTNEIREIKISAKRFGFEPVEINVKKGEKIKLIVTNTDIQHGIMIPELIFPPTQTDFNEVEFTAEQEGSFDFFCTNEICGSGHGRMRGKIVVS